MNFKREAKDIYKNDEKLELAKTVEKCKRQYDEEVEKNREKTKYDYKRKKHFAIKPKSGFYSKAVREFYADMKNVSNNDPDFQRAIKVATCAFEDIAELRDSALRSIKKARALGGGRKCKALKIRVTSFSWFIVREVLKGRLPKCLFKLKAKELYAEWWFKIQLNQRHNSTTQTWESDSSIDLEPEFVFKGKGTPTKLNPPLVSNSSGLRVAPIELIN